MPSQSLSSQYSPTGTTDSIASSYRPPEPKKVQSVARPVFTQSSSRPSSTKYPYQSQPQQRSDEQDIHVSEELIHHPTIIKLQQQNFHRLISSADSTSSSSVIKQQQVLEFDSTRDDDRSTYFSSIIATNDHPQSDKHVSGNQRAVLNQRKQALMKAIQSINKQMEELDMQ